MWDVNSNTNTNTFVEGAISAACISLQQKLERFLLWAACRHHIGEVILTWVWIALLIEVSKSPEISLFLRLRADFEKISYKDFTNLHFLEIEDELLGLKEQVLQLIDSVLADKTFKYRGDYLVCLKLVRLVLTGNTDGFQFSRLGACHKARWMGKIIGALDLFLLQKKIFTELPFNRIMTLTQAALIGRFVKFVALVYTKWWIRCPLIAESGILDLELLSDIRAYPDKVIATAAENALKRHLWYLTEEISPVCIFSS